MKKLVLALLLAASAWGQAVLVRAPASVSVSYRILNATSLPEFGLSDSAPIVGVVVLLRCLDATSAKFDVELTFTGEDGTPHTITKTIERSMTRGGYNPLPIPVLFSAQMLEIQGIAVRGFIPY